jgi:hypothetical protein
VENTIVLNHELFMKKCASAMATAASPQIQFLTKYARWVFLRDQYGIDINDTYYMYDPATCTIYADTSFPLVQQVANESVPIEVVMGVACEIIINPWIIPETSVTHSIGPFQIKRPRKKYTLAANAAVGEYTAQYRIIFDTDESEFKVEFPGGITRYVARLIHDSIQQALDAVQTK